MNISLSDAAALLKDRDEVLILTHKRPDGDTIGCASALCHALRRLGKTAYLYRNSDINELYAPIAAPYLAPEGYIGNTVLSTDIAEATLFPPGWSGNVLLAVDHHPARSEFSDYILRDSSRAACGELLIELIEALCGGLDREEADLLYIAVSTDTGCFVHANTNAATHRAAAKLLEAGADLRKWNKLLFCTKSPARLALEGEVYATLRSYKEHTMNIAVITLDMLRRTGVIEGDLEDLASLAGQVAGNRASVTVRETKEGRSKVSLRTDGTINATEVCARFGGGGHRMASGCEIDLPPHEAAEAVRRVLEEVWP